MLDPAAFGLTDGLGAKNPYPTNQYNLTEAIAQMNTAGTWGNETDSGALFTFQYADQNPGAPAEFPPGTPLTPPLNPFTNETWTNITEWAAFVTFWGWGYAGISNIYEGYGNASVVIHILATFDRYWPTRLGLETTAYTDWNNCPDITHDFDDQYCSIDAPLLAFQSQYSGNLVFGPFRDGIANPVFNTTVLLGYGHLDIFSGVYSARDVSAPTYDWMVRHISPVHDVAITSLTSPYAKTVIGKGYNGNLTVTAQNLGEYAEIFNVTVYVNTTAINTFNSSLASETRVFVWNTTGFAYGNYTISAYAWPVSGETNTANNNMTVWVTVTIPGDLNGDFKVSLADLVLLANAYGSVPGDSKWNPNADVSGDGKVSLTDLVLMANHYGQHYP
jgi:hypothetical protein